MPGDDDSLDTRARKERERRRTEMWPPEGYNLWSAEALLVELERRDGHLSAEMWALGSCFRQVAKLLDADPWDAFLLRAYREIGAALREGRTSGFDPDVAALIERISAPPPSREW
jgi:hypothetical protein